MIRSIRPAPWLLALLVPSLSAAWALANGGLRQNAESLTFTPPLGVAGAKTVELATAPDYFGVQALKLWDFDGRTCSMQLEQGALNAPSTGVLEATKVCEPRSREAWQRADLGVGHFASAIAICTSKAKDAHAVRGIELWGVSVAADAKLKPTNESVRIKFPGCEKWSAKRACPKGAIATGIRAYLDGDDSGVVGLSLRCHELARQTE